MWSRHSPGRTQKSPSQASPTFRVQNDEQEGKIWSHLGRPKPGIFFMGAREVICKSDSHLVVGQVKWEFKVKDSLLQWYYHAVLRMIRNFQSMRVEQIWREDNIQVDLLCRLFTTKKKSHDRSIIQVSLKTPTVGQTKCLTRTECDNWITPIWKFLEHRTCEANDEKTMKQRCARYLIIGQELFRRCARSLLKCISDDQVK